MERLPSYLSFRLSLLQCCANMFRFGLMLEMGFSEIAIMGLTLLLCVFFRSYVHNVDMIRVPVAARPVGDSVKTGAVPRVHRTCSKRSFRGLGLRDTRIVGNSAVDDMGDYRDSVTDSNMKRELAEKNAEESTWVLRQYYGGMCEEEVDNISNYSAK